MQKILLTQNRFATVDDEDFEFLNQWKWHCSHHGYAVRRPRSGVVWMHRLITGVDKQHQVDHISGDRLDNRKSNLRIVTNQQNAFNRTRLNKNNNSGYPGVAWFKPLGKWRARIMINYKDIHLGVFDTLDEAIKVRLQAKELYHG